MPRCVKVRFQDLDFEEATLVGSGFYSASAAFPGWQVLIGTTPTSEVVYDALSTGGAEVSITDDKNGFVPIQGSYTAFLFASSVPGHDSTVSLSQTGTVPTGNEWIELDANQASSSSFSVALNGTPVTMTPVQTYPNYTLYGGNISAWSGQTATTGNYGK